MCGGGGGSSFPRHSPAAAPLGSREDRSPGRGLARASTPAGGRALGCEAPAPTEDTRPLHVTPARVTGRVKAGPDLHAPRRVSNRQRPLWACASLQGGAALPVHHCSSGVAASVPRAMPSWFHVSHRRPTHWAWLPLPKGRGSFRPPRRPDFLPLRWAVFPGLAGPQTPLSSGDGPRERVGPPHRGHQGEGHFMKGDLGRLT